MSLQIESNKILLKADNDLWYWLTLVEEDVEGSTSLFFEVDPIPDTPIGNPDPYVILDSPQGPYKLSLYYYQSDGQDMVTPSWDPSDTSEGMLEKLTLRINQTLYDITLIFDEIITPDITVSSELSTTYEQLLQESENEVVLSIPGLPPSSNNNEDIWIIIHRIKIESDILVLKNLYEESILKKDYKKAKFYESELFAAMSLLR